MEHPIEDKRALRLWTKSEVSYQNYKEYINRKPNKFDLSIFDLFYLKNFKGGSATFCETEKDVRDKLTSYSHLLIEINKYFKGKKLSELDNNQVEQLINFAEQGFDLVNPKNPKKIDGFSYAFLTTLLHFHFPNLYPILDRRVLNGLKLIKKSDLTSQKQVKKIQLFYPKLIQEFKEKTGSTSFRNLDRELFTKKFI